MKKTLTSLLLAMTIAVAIPCLLFAQEATATSGNDKVRVGVFDSRAVAMAYYRSSSFNEELKAMHADLKTAKKAADEESVKELEAKGIALQNLMHKQGFGTWPIDDIVKRINDQLPGIAEQAGVTLIVSQWDVVYKRTEFKFVDVTDQMVAPFEPDAATLKVIEEIRTRQPVSQDEIDRHKH